MLENRKFFVMVLVLFFFLLSGLTQAHAQFGLGGAPPQQKLEPKLLSSDNGRFVFGQISASHKDKFMLDTWSGRLWRIAESGEIGLFLRAVPYRIGDGEYTPLPEKLPGPGQEGTEKKPKGSPN
jgi:hypothetical protein